MLYVPTKFKLSWEGAGGKLWPIPKGELAQIKAIVSLSCILYTAFLQRLFGFPTDEPTGTRRRK